MLFKRIFNWLKLKSITPSTLYRNRLFIERDSKKRRVMSNFGLTFRNSKWTDYSLNNVSLKSIERSKSLLFNTFSALFLVMSLWFLTFFANKLDIILIPREMGWVLYDWTTLTLTFTCISYKNTIVIFLQSLLNFFWKQIFSANIKRTQYSDQSQPLEIKSLVNSTNKTDINTYLTLSTLFLKRAQEDRHLNNTLLKLYKQNYTPSNFYISLDFYKNLYRLNHCLAQLNNFNSLIGNLEFNQNSRSIESIVINPSYNHYFTLTLNYYLRDLLQIKYLF